MKKTAYLLLFFSVSLTYGQTRKVKLNEAIQMAQKKSIDYEAALNRYRSSYWAFRNYKAGFLPQLGLQATLPNYSEAITVIAKDDGSEDFATRNQVRTDLNLSLRQNLALTGGTFSVGSSIERIRNLGTNQNTRYFFTPFSINYSQKSIFYNPFKWDKKIEPLRYEESQRDFLEKMEIISSKTCRLYFNLLKTQIQLKIANNNLSNQDTLLKISEGRFKMGKIAENELLQMELSYLNSKKEVTDRSILLKRTSQNLALFLGINSENLELTVPENLETFNVSLDKALNEGKSNRKDVIEFRRRRLQAEKQLARAKGTNRLTLDINARLGRSRSANNLDDLLNNFDKQQGVSLQIGFPILDWGVSKSARKRAQANLDLENTTIEQDQRNFEQEIEFHVLNWSNQRDLLKISKKAKEIAIKSYNIAKKRYLIGKITITDLNLAQQNMDRSNINYLNSLEGFWNDYYTLRRLTLYDFIKDTKITTEDILFD